MNQLARTLLVSLTLCASATGCSKKDAAPQAAASATPAAPCGADYADPQKEFCLKLPASFKPKKPRAPSELYSLDVEFEGENDGVHVLVGFTSTNMQSYDEQLKSDDEWIATKKPIASGPMTGTGKWWSYDNDGYKSFKAIVKSNGGKTIFCGSTSVEASQEVADICKTLRAYPK